jgi:hypothetical protein
MTHTVMTFVARVRPEKKADLSALLDAIGNNPETNPYVPFRKLMLLHFASLVLHDSHKEYGYGPYLVFENNFDGPLEPFLEDLYAQAQNGLHQIYSCCEDYTVTNAADRQALFAFLKSHVVLPNAYHIGNTGRSAERILQEQRLRDALETCADGLLQDGKLRSPKELCEALKSFVSANPEFARMPAAGPRQTFLERFIPWVKIVLVALIAALILFNAGALAWKGFPWVLIGLLVLAGAYLIRLRMLESTDSVKLDAANPNNLKQLVEKEDLTHNVQNHMASITIVKPGWLRRVTLWAVLWAVNLLARAQATHGELGGIPSIHFAHWSMIDGGRRLLFLSNFDGSWENYLDDFIDKAHRGLTAVWSNTVGFPRTQFLVGGGAMDGPRFKAVARDAQTVTNAWYSAYRDLTVQGIDKNSSIREYLSEPTSKQSPEAWLQLL